MTPDRPKPGEVEEALAKILVSSGFQRAERLGRFLEYVVRQTLEGKRDEIKETLIGVEVYGRPPGYDPRVDSIVRMEASRLRARLLDYYSNGGSADPVTIQIPKGAYVPAFSYTSASAGPKSTPWKKLALAAGLAFGVLAVVSAWSYVRGPANQLMTSLVVLPFVNLSGDDSLEYFSDGLTEEVIDALTPISGLRVVARTSAFEFKGKNQDIRTIAQRLGVDAVMEGSIRIQGDHLRVTAQLNDARNGYHYWSHTWNHGMRDVFAVQQEIAAEVSEALGHRAMPEARPLTRNLVAYDYYLKAISQWEAPLKRDTLEAAAALYRRAIAEDPNFAAAYAQIALLYQNSFQVGNLTREEAMPFVRANAAKALELDQDLPLANFVQSYVSLADDWDWKAAERFAQKARVTDPYLLTITGHPQEAFAALQARLAANPLDSAVLYDAAFLFRMLGDSERGLVAAKRALEVHPGLKPAIWCLRWNAEDLGLFEEAVAAAKLDDDLPTAFTEDLSRGLKERGAKGYWRAWYEFEPKRKSTALLHARQMALFTARLGYREEMLGWVTKMIDLRDNGSIFLNAEPALRPYSRDAEFQKLVRRVGLKPID
jgi:serine/threonine-protein kinase